MVFKMLFVIDKSIVEHLRLNVSQPTIVTTAMECLAHARRAGQNLVFAEREVLDFLRKYDMFSPSVKSVFNKLYSRVAQDKSYYDFLTWRVRIVPESDQLLLIQTESQNEIIVSADYVANPVFTSPTIVLSENQSDVHFYERIARAYMHWSSLGKVDLQLESRGGGGNTCDVEYEKIQSRLQRFCLCILDSDLKYPGCTIGGTLKAVQAVDSPSNPLCLVFAIPVHEIENLVSISLYDLAIGSDASRNRILPFLYYLEKSTFADARKYIDLKKGIRLYDIISSNCDMIYSKYWSVITSDFKINLNCVANSPCKSRKTCSCVLVNGMGDRVLNDVINVLQNKNDSEVTNLVNTELRPLWEMIGSLIVAWCGAGSKMSVS